MAAGVISMQRSVEPIERVSAEIELIEELLAPDGRRMVDLGCGRAELTRALAQRGRDRHITAFEVDEAQHALNVRSAALPNVEFRLGGAQAIASADATFAIAFMFKSLHHVPVELMPVALQELARVLRPGGMAWLSEPIYGGPLNEIVRLFHDEKVVRERAFDAVVSAVDRGSLQLVRQLFFRATVRFASFAEFESRVIGATHTRHVLSPQTYAQVREHFDKHLRSDGATFLTPMRVDLLRKP